MKNLSTRTKKVLAIAGLVIVVVVAGLVLLGPSGAGLFGASGAWINPSNPTLHVGDSWTLYVVDPTVYCYWTRTGENKDVVLFTPPTTGVTHVQITGNQPGSVIITAHCGLFGLGQEPSTTVTVQ